MVVSWCPHCGLGNAKKSYGERNIIQHDVKPRSSSGQVFPHQPSHILTLRDQLAGVELRDHALQHFVHNRREDPLVVVGAEGTVDLRERFDARTGEDTAGDVDHLQVFGAGEGGDVSWLGADVVGYGGFEPGDVEVCS